MTTVARHTTVLVATSAEKPTASAATKQQIAKHAAIVFPRIAEHSFAHERGNPLGSR